MSTRRFRVGEGRTLTLPLGLVEGATHSRVVSGEVVEIEVDRINGARGGQPFARFIAGCLRNGDLVEDATTFATPARASTVSKEPKP